MLFFKATEHITSCLIWEEVLGVPVRVLVLTHTHTHVRALQRKGAIIPTKHHVLSLSQWATCCESDCRQ